MKTLNEIDAKINELKELQAHCLGTNTSVFYSGKIAVLRWVADYNYE